MPGAFLHDLNASAVAPMTVVTIRRATTSLLDVSTVAPAVAAVWFRVNVAGRSSPAPHADADEVGGPARQQLDG